MCEFIDICVGGIFGSYDVSFLGVAKRRARQYGGAFSKQGGRGYARLAIGSASYQL